MKLLALDTSTHYLSIALSAGSEVASFHESVGQKHAERTLPEIGRLLQQCGLQLSELDAIAFSQGPGSFTGLRIGCALAQGLAFSAGLPLIAIPTLDNIARQAGPGRVQVCLDARMEQVYCASYQVDESCVRLDDIRVLSPEELLIAPDIVTAAGDGFAAYPQLRERAAGLRLAEHLMPDARAHIELARSGRYPARPAREAELLYIRDKVALTAVEQQQARAR